MTNTPEHDKLSDRRPSEGNHPFVEAAYQYVQSVLHTADTTGRNGVGFAWHGWALREAFLAGISYAGAITDTDETRAKASELIAEAKALSILDERKIVKRAVEELRAQVDYLRGTIIDVFHALNPKVSRKPRRDAMKTAANLRGQASYLYESIEADLREKDAQIAKLTAERDAARKDESHGT